VTHVLHCAANTSLRSVRGVRLANVVGALTLAHRMRRCRGLRRYVHVSTAYACGLDAPRVVHEDHAPRADAAHAMEYTASKAEAEMLLANTAPELPLVVARPSAVVGHTRLGCRPSASLFWYYHALALLRRVPFSPSARRDIVPVDYVAAALVALLFLPRPKYRCYHVSAGEASAAPWGDIQAEFDSRLSGAASGPVRRVSWEELRRRRGWAQRRLGCADMGRMLELMEAPFRLGASQVEVFDHSRLREEGLPAPTPFPVYLGTCWESVRGQGPEELMRADD
jgi:nucleoside-diphosphate-sugar epimerase